MPPSAAALSELTALVKNVSLLSSVCPPFCPSVLFSLLSFLHFCTLLYCALFSLLSSRLSSVVLSSVLSFLSSPVLSFVLSCSLICPLLISFVFSSSLSFYPSSLLSLLLSSQLFSLLSSLWSSPHLYFSPLSGPFLFLLPVISSGLSFISSLLRSKVKSNKHKNETEMRQVTTLDYYL